MASKIIEELLQEALVPIEEQPYEIPENWVWIYAPYLFDIEYGKNLAISELKEIGYPVFGANGQIGYYNEYTYEDSKILVSCRGANSGKINVSLPKSFITNNSLILNQKLNMSNDFIRYLFESRDKSTLISGTAQPQITLKAFRSFPLPLLPQPEQQRISAKAESLFSKIDKVQELIEEVREVFENRKISILAEAFRGKLTKKWRADNLDIESAKELIEKIRKEIKKKDGKKNNKNVNSKIIQEAYKLPKTWEWVRIGDIVKLTSGGTPSRKRKDYYEGDIPWIKTGELKWNDIYTSEEFINDVAIKESSAKLLPEDTVLVAMYGQGLTRGRAAILKTQAACNQAVCALIVNKYIDSKYLFYYFMEGYWRFRQEAQGGNQPNFNGKIISGFEIQLPPVEEQKEIVRILDNLLSSESEIEELTNLEDQIELLKKSILAKAFRGELDTNDPTEESAIELLKVALKEKTK